MEPSKLSLELLPHHLPSLRTKERSDFLSCFDDEHMTPLVGFFVTDLSFGFVCLRYLTLIDLDVFGSFLKCLFAWRIRLLSAWRLHHMVEGAGEGNGFCPCLFFAIVSIVLLGMKEHTLCGCCNWLMRSRRWQWRHVFSLLLSLFKLENTSVCLSLLRCWFPFIDHPYRCVCVSEKVMDESVSCVALVAS